MIRIVRTTVLLYEYVLACSDMADVGFQLEVVGLVFLCTGGGGQPGRGAKCK